MCSSYTDHSMITLTNMKNRSKTTLARHHIVQLLEDEYKSSVRLLKLIEDKIKDSIVGIEPTIEVLLIRNGVAFYPNANIEKILGILQYERQFEAFIKLSHAFFCCCKTYDPPCCRWLTVKNTWAFEDKITSTCPSDKL